MKTRAFGWTGWPVSVVGQGTWRMEANDPAACIAALRRGIELGMNHIDTAELYGQGRVEERVVREAVRGLRSKVFLVSKVLPANASYVGTLKACEASLRRLGTEYLDAYLLHWPGSHPLEDTLRAFEELVKVGKIRAWGVSNFDVAELEEALAIAGEGRMACNQVLYHLGERTVEHQVIPWCERHEVAVVAYSPLGAGSFPSPTSRGGRVLEELSRSRQATPRQLALAYLSRRPSLFTIPKHSTVAHAEQNAASARLELTADEVRAIEAAFPLRARRELPTI